MPDKQTLFEFVHRDGYAVIHHRHSSLLREGPRPGVASFTDTTLGLSSWSSR